MKKKNSKKLKHTRDASSAVDEGKDHATKSPSNSLNAHSGALGGGLGHPHDSQDSDIEEQEGGHELGNAGTVEGP